MDSDDLRAQLGVPGSFCIYIEDNDGNVFLVNASDERIRSSIGDEEVIVGGVACGDPMT
jgi:hypothetical protein